MRHGLRPRVHRGYIAALAKPDQEGMSMRFYTGTIAAATILTAALAVGGRAADENAPTAKEKGDPMVILSTTMGDIKIELYSDKAPGTVQNFIDYARAGYYDGTIFHRVIPGFMIQGGGLTTDMQDKTEGRKPPIRNESSNGLRNDTGTVAMARTSAPDSATSQFFINVVNNDFLNKDKAADKVGYAVFGKVVDGMDVVKKIEGVKTTNKGPHQNVPVDAVVIKSARVVDGASAK
jgi:peptidyl-prolyl cis-trans isomerase A (cyclophilin A)